SQFQFHMVPQKLDEILRHRPAGAPVGEIFRNENMQIRVGVGHDGVRIGLAERNGIGALGEDDWGAETALVFRRIKRCGMLEMYLQGPPVPAQSMPENVEEHPE